MRRFRNKGADSQCVLHIRTILRPPVPYEIVVWYENTLDEPSSKPERPYQPKLLLQTSVACWLPLLKGWSLKVRPALQKYKYAWWTSCYISRCAEHSILIPRTLVSKFPFMRCNRPGSQLRPHCKHDNPTTPYQCSTPAAISPLQPLQSFVLAWKCTDAH